MFTCTDDIATLAATFTDPIEYSEAVAQLADCGWECGGVSPAMLARAIVRVFGTYEIYVA